jgi:hypothetical protein
VSGMFVRLLVEIRRGEEGVLLPPGTIIRLPDWIASALIEQGIAVPERTDVPSHEAERR